MSHSHQHTIEENNINKAFLVGIILNALFVLIEALVGLSTKSLALLTDAGHNLSDVASLGLALLAIKLSKVKATQNFTYGYKKSTILVALANAVILLIAIGGIAWEAFIRMDEPKEIPGKTIAIVALIGVFINSVTAYLFIKGKEKDLNVKGAYLHLVADAAVSLGVVIGGVIIIYTRLFWIDTFLSLIIVVVIFISTWKLLKETIRLSLDGVPQNIDTNEIIKAAEKIDGVINVHHIHIWAISTNQNALTAHVLIKDYKEVESIKQELKHSWEHLNVQHITIEFETKKCDKGEVEC